MYQQILPAVRITLLFTVLTGIVYPLAVTGLAQTLFHSKANGSLIVGDGRVIGSELIGQNFAKPQYFHPRPSAAGDAGFDGMASGGSNLGPTSKKLADRVQMAVDQFHKENPTYTGPIPSDLLTTSASGLDPHISPASAEAQLARVAAARGVDLAQVRALVAQHTESADWGFLGEPRVNVLMLNLDLDSKLPAKTGSR